MVSPGLAAMVPTLEKLFKIKRTPLAGVEGAAACELAGIPGGQAVRLDGAADGKPFVIVMVTQP